jgi:hypothetical protein
LGLPQIRASKVREAVAYLHKNHPEMVIDEKFRLILL